MGNIELADYCYFKPGQRKSTDIESMGVPTNKEDPSERVNDSQVVLSQPLDEQENEATEVGGAHKEAEPKIVSQLENSTVRQSTESVATASGVCAGSSNCDDHSVRIIRIDSKVKLFPSNIESMFNRGKISFECDTLNDAQCLKYLKTNLLDCKLAIAKAMSSACSISKRAGKIPFNKNG